MTVLACSSCLLGDAARLAYWISTAVLLLLPFAMVSGFVAWLRRPERRPRRAALAGRSSPLLLAALGCLLALGLVPLLHTEPGAPRALPALPRFRLVDQTGQPFGTQELAGKVWVADFVFTRCPSVCPALTERMAELQRRLHELPRVHLVSFSVDPEHDTPEVLARYAERHGADQRRWTFLTGPLGQVRTAVEEGLRVSMGGVKDTGGDLLHGTRFVLVDGAGRIRGYHDVKDEADLARLQRAVEELATGPL